MLKTDFVTQAKRERRPWVRKTVHAKALRWVASIEASLSGCQS